MTHLRHRQPYAQCCDMGERFPLRLVIGLAVAIALDTALQLVWKTGVAALPETSSLWETIVAVARAPIFVLVAALMAAQLVNWLKVLDHADLSYAKPFTSLGYVTVCMLSVLWLGERIPPPPIPGIIIAVTGGWVLGLTPPAAVPPAPARRFAGT